MKLDILVIGAHPDDAEISAGGTILSCVAQGKKVGILDLTSGELGSRGSGELRLKEAEKASQILGIHARENLFFADGFFARNEDAIRKLIGKLRFYRPDIVLANALHDRHPDHGRAAGLIADACFYSGLRKIETGQEVWVPSALFHYVQDYYNRPDFVFDITPYWEKKIEALKAYSSQFFDPFSQEPETPISGENFFRFLQARAMDFGRPAGFLFAEGFVAARTVGINTFDHFR
ncbi:MAG: bacillithiol biosynthesis deacetylase BshB1 [Crocinitomicaceae bacterium]|nr:bacillithiol biosynthesis deacetylase BshB1 [Crocinitomicaceae bacterium]